MINVLAFVILFIVQISGKKFQIFTACIKRFWCSSFFVVFLLLYRVLWTAIQIGKC